MLDGDQPNYLIWLAENTDIDLSHDILEDAERIDAELDDAFYLLDIYRYIWGDISWKD